MPDRPVFIVKYDGHTSVVNTALLNILPEKIRSLRGYNSESGEMKQEAALRLPWMDASALWMQL